MKKKIILIGILALIGMLALIVGCAFEKAGSEEEAIVEITINQEMFTAKTIEPDISMDIKEYLLKWWLTTEDESAASTKTVTPSSSGGSTTVYLLLSPNSYYFKIEGYNAVDGFAAGDPAIGESDKYPAPTVVMPRKTLNIELVIKPVDATGSLKITVDWELLVPDTLDASVTANIYAFDADISTDPSLYTFSSDPASGVKTAVISGSGLDDGYYKCVIKMIDDSDSLTLWKTIDALRIVSNYTSTETYVLDYQLDTLVTVNITEDMQNPLDIDFYIADMYASGWWYHGTVITDPFYITIGTNIHVWAYPRDPSTGIGTSVDSFEWYRDGSKPLVASDDLITSISEILTGSGYPAGSYSLSVLVTKGTTLSSRSIQFIVMP